MRRIFVLFLLLGTSIALSAADIEFVRVWPAWRDAESFRRISEYFTGRENTGREIVRRSQPERRDGFYFLVRLDNRGSEQPAARIVLSLIKPDAPQVREFTFSAPIKRGEHVYHLGVTGTDWPGPKLHPVAWKIEVFAADGTVLGVNKSFLWEKPAAP